MAFGSIKASITKPSRKPLEKTHRYLPTQRILCGNHIVRYCSTPQGPHD